MSWKESLSSKLSAYAGSEFDYVETKDINEASKIDLGCSGIYMEATVAFFEIKNLPFIVKENGRRKSAQAFTMVSEVISTIAQQEGAFVNRYAPNSFLIVFPGRDESLAQAVKSTLKITHALSEDFKPQFSGFLGFEFSMGLDHGHIMGTKTLSDNGMETISWFGTCIYKARCIADECSRPFYVGISSAIYHSLSEDLRIAQRRILGIKKNVEMWNKVSYQFDNVKKHLYQTNHKFSLEDE